MAHMIENNKAFYTGKPAWHGLGTVLQDAPSIEEAWRLAYPHNLFKWDTQIVAPNGATLPFPDCKAVVRRLRKGKR